MTDVVNQIQEQQNIKNENTNYLKSSYWIYDKKIPEAICDLIIQDLKNHKCSYGSIGEKNNIDLKYRFVKSVTVPSDHWALGILLYFGFDANTTNFQYYVNRLDFTTFLTYEKGMFYLPHIDVSPHTNDPTSGRKLTVILQLSDENDYKGGDIILYDGNLKPKKMPRDKGTIIVFNSSLIHSVSKITNGTRHSLCGWIMGPPFA